MSRSPGSTIDRSIGPDGQMAVIKSVALPVGDDEVTYMNPLTRSYTTHLKAAGRSPNTIRDRRNLLIRLDEELPEGLNAVSTEDLEQWLAPYTGWTLYTYHTTIRDAFRFFVTCGHDFDPSSGLAQPRPPDDEPRPATDEQVAQALAELTGVAYRAVLLAVGDGLRCGEIARLHRQHVNPETLWVSRKGAKTQLLPTHEEVWRHLVAVPPGLVVQTPRGRQFSSTYLSNVVSTALTKIGQPDVTLHRFRSSFATRLANAGVHATVIQDLMGHKRLDTTQRYIKVTNGQRRNAIATLPVPASPQQKAA